VDCSDPECRHSDARHEWVIDTEVELGGRCLTAGCDCQAFRMKCQIGGCLDQAVLMAVRLNSYTDTTKQDRCSLRIKMRLCVTHRYLHGHSWTTLPYPKRYSKAVVVCQVEGCCLRGRRVEVQFNTHRERTHHRKSVRRSAWVYLCRNHQFVHGFAWTRKPFPFDSFGAFWEDLERFGLRVPRRGKDNVHEERGS
jgi:hypothetical protein